MNIFDYIYNKVYAPVENDFGFDDAGDIDEHSGEAPSASQGDGELYEHWRVEVDANQDPVRIDKYLAASSAASIPRTP